MDQCQKILALHSLEGHKCCQPVCVLSARRSCPKALPKNCTLCLKSSRIQNKMKFSPALSQQRREIAYATLPFPAEQRELFVLCCSPTAWEWEKKICLFFPGTLAYSNTWIFAVSRRGFANKKRMELYLRRTSLWKLSNTLLFFPIPKFPNLKEKKCFSSVGTSLMSACIAHRAS